MNNVTFVAAALVLLQGPASDVRLPNHPDLAITLPVSPDATADLLQRVLTTAGVRFALEGAPVQKSALVPGEAFAPPAGLDRLGGLLLREALDRITAADPRYEWSEVDGRILVRPVVTQGSDALLQQRVKSFAVRNASLQDTLAMLMSALGDRSQERRGLMTGAAIALASPPAQPTSVDGRPRPLTLSISDATVYDILEAIAKSAGLSWTVRYNGPAPTVEHAVVTLGTQSFSATSMPRAPRETRDGKRAVLVPLMGSLTTSLMMYGHRVKAQVGIETVPAPFAPPASSRSSAPLDLTDVPPSNGIARIVALEPRYGWSDAGGIFNVRPRADLAARTPLDQEVDEFVANGETAEAILDRIARLLGEGSGRGEGWGSIEGSEERRKQLAASRRPLSFSVRKTSIRELLNTLCRTEGTLSWSVTPLTDPKGIAVSLNLNSWDGWGPSRTVRRQAW